MVPKKFKQYKLVYSATFYRCDGTGIEPATNTVTPHIQETAVLKTETRLTPQQIAALILAKHTKKTNGKDNGTI